MLSIVSKQCFLVVRATVLVVVPISICAEVAAATFGSATKAVLREFQ